MAALALLMAVHTVASTGEDDPTPHAPEETVEAIRHTHTRKEHE